MNYYQRDIERCSYTLLIIVSLITAMFEFKLICENIQVKCTHRARLQDLIHAEEYQEDQTAEEDVHEHPVNHDIVFINSLTEC